MQTTRPSWLARRRGLAKKLRPDVTDPFAGFLGLATEVDGKVTLYPVRAAGKKSKFRFAWGAPGRRSGAWNVIALQSGDVYINEQTLAADVKVSLHKQRWWQVSFVENGGQMSSAGQRWMESHDSRHLHRRERLAGQDPVVLGMRVFVTLHDIQDWPDEDETEDSLTWLEPPDEGEIGFVLVFFLKPNPRVLELQQLGILNTYPMKNGEVVLTTFGYQSLGSHELRVMVKMRTDFIKMTTPEQIATYPAGFAPRSVLSVTSDADELGAWDAAMIEVASTPEVPP